MKEVVVEFEGRMNVEVRKQEKLEMAEEKDLRREELSEKYMTKIINRTMKSLRKNT